VSECDLTTLKIRRPGTSMDVQPLKKDKDLELQLSCLG
jgi:hypothetical protein